MNSRKLLLDTNILLDYIIPERPEQEAAIELLGQIDSGDTVEGYFTATSFKDVYYVLRKYLDDTTVRDILRGFMHSLTLLPVGIRETMQALASNEPDFEDGIVRAVAENNNIDFLITRDAAAFQHSKVRSMNAREYLELFPASK